MNDKVCASYHEGYEDENHCATPVGVSELFGFTIWVVDNVKNQFLLSTHSTNDDGTHIRITKKRICEENAEQLGVNGKKNSPIGASSSPFHLQRQDKASNVALFWVPKPKTPFR